MIVLKNNKGTDEVRARHLDYGVQISGYFYKRLLEKKNISLFSPSDVPGLFNAYFSNQDEFARLYEQYEADDNIPRITLPAMEVFQQVYQERANTGRIYIMNVDHVNNHGPFDSEVAPITMSNLCAEIALPTKPLTNILDESGEIALCTLAAVNLGELESLDELENLQDLLVRALDAILDYQDYPVPAAKTSTRKYRPLGIGVINYAYYLAKNHSSYMDPRGNDLTHRTFEAFEYYAIKASVQLAKEKGACETFENTRWAQGKMPIDRYKKEVDEVHNEPLHLDWDTLREDVVKHGIRNATLTALMPSESSSTVSNATNGIEPPRYHVTVKSNKDMTVKQLVPNFKKDGYRVQTAWELSDMSGYIEKVAIMQKFICQSISANTWYKPSNYPNGLLPMKVIIADQVKAYRLGIKTWYYHNTHDDASDDSHQDDCAGGACKI